MPTEKRLVTDSHNHGNRSTHRLCRQLLLKVANAKQIKASGESFNSENSDLPTILVHLPSWDVINVIANSNIWYPLTQWVSISQSVLVG
jgi:hypothetical protein